MSMPAQISPDGLLSQTNNTNQAMLDVELDARGDALPTWQKPWKPVSFTDKSLTASLSNIISWLWPHTWHNRPKSLHKTAYLDGLRGFAALLVYIQHHVLWVHNPDRMAMPNVFENGFGYDGKYYFAALPGIRLFFAGGHMAVAVFFVLSGYVLSIKPLRLIENDDIVGLVDHLASSVFRRWLRLFLPVAAVIIVYATSWHAFGGIWVDGAKPHGSWLDEMWFMYCEFKNFTYVYKEGGLPWLSYNVHAWSLPVEFRGSLVIFASLLAFSRCTLNARLWCQVALIYYFMYIADGSSCAMFMAGMLLSHLDLLAAADRLPLLIARLRPYKTVLCYHLLAVGIYLGGIPCETSDVNQLARNRGWYLLSFLKPQAVFDYKWFYLFWAATALVTAVSNLGWLKRFFETRICQYLGRVSFALYLVHGPVLWTLGDRLYASVGYKSPRQMEHIPQWVDRITLPEIGPVGLELSFLLPHLVLLPVTFCLADFVTRAVDKPTVQFAAWLYKKTLPSVPRKQSKA